MVNNSESVDTVRKSNETFLADFGPCPEEFAASCESVAYLFADERGQPASKCILLDYKGFACTWDWIIDY